MSNKNELSRITIDIPKVDHRRLKAMAAIHGKSMREIILESIEERLCENNYPNKETLEAIAEVEKGEDLVEAKDAKDLFKKLGF